MNRPRQHEYTVTVDWTGNLGEGTSDYRAYSRDHDLLVTGKPPIAGSADPAFRGDGTRHNPEDLLVGSLSACHMLWYLHLCADAGIVVLAYRDKAQGTMVETDNGGGRFSEVVLHPVVTIAADGNTDLAERLHERAHELCFIAASMNFPVRCEPDIRIGE